MATKQRPRSKSRDRNILTALGIAILIALAAIYYEAPSVINKSSTTSTNLAAGAVYPFEYGNADNCACSPVTNMPASNASALTESAFNSYPTQTSPFLAGGGSLQVGESGFSYIANVGNYELYGMNIETQNEIYDIAIPNSPLTPIPYATPFFHLALTQTIGGSPEVWVSTPWDGVYAFPTVNAQNANYGFNMTGPVVGQDGNKGTYSWAAPIFSIDETKSMLVGGLAVNTTGIPGRGFVQGWKIGSPTNVPLIFGQTEINVTSATKQWTTYLSPPQDGSDPSWEMQQVNSIPYVWEFNGTAAINLKALSSSALSSVLSNDWTSSNGVYSTGPESNSSWLTDTSTGTTYLVTSAPQTVSMDGTFNGPALFSSSVIALDTQTGAIKWTFQFTPHDVWGWGCTGNLAMVPAVIGGTTQQVLAKQCENGYLFLLNPTTGALLYSTQLPGVVRASGASIPNVMSSSDMTESLQQVSGANATQTPVRVSMSNIAYDQSDDLLMGAIGQGSTPLGSESPPSSSFNSTVYALDLSSPHMQWMAPVPDLDFSYISVANGVAYMGTYEGSIIVASTQTGTQLELIHAAEAVSSLFVEDGVHGQAGLVVGGYGLETKQQIQTYTYTPEGVLIGSGGHFG